MMQKKEKKETTPFPPISNKYQISQKHHPLSLMKDQSVIKLIDL